MYERGNRWLLVGVIGGITTQAVVTVEGRCDHLVESDKQCRNLVGAMVYQTVGLPDPAGQTRYAYRWSGLLRGLYLDAPAARHQPADLGDLPGFQDVYPADPAPAVLEGFCADHGVRYAAAQPLLDLTIKDSKRTSDTRGPHAFG